MSLFTSSFRTELKVLAMILVMLACIEAGTRVFERRIAVGVHTPEAAKKLIQGDGTRVLIMGNSLVRDGINALAVEQVMNAKRDAVVHVERYYLVSSTMSDWYYIFKNSFITAGRKPDVLVLCFALSHLQDGPITRPEVAYYYSSVSDLSDIFANQIRDFDGRTEFLLSKVSLSFAERRALERRAMDVTIPHYRLSANVINETLKAKAPPNRFAATYIDFQRLLVLAKRSNVPVIVVAMPGTKSYEIPSIVQDMQRSGEISVIDDRSVPELNGVAFTDDFHLSSSGMAEFSRYLADQLETFASDQANLH